jgi:hypothetical protein
VRQSSDQCNLDDIIGVDEFARPRRQTPSGPTSETGEKASGQLFFRAVVPRTR